MNHEILSTCCASVISNCDFFFCPPKSKCEGIRCITNLSRVYIKKPARCLYLTCIFRECNVVLSSMISHIALKIKAASLMEKVTLYLVSTEMRNIEVKHEYM